MSRKFFVPAFLIAALVTGLVAGSAASAAPKDPPPKGPKDSGIVGGLVIDKHPDVILVQVDGEDEPTKYLIGPDTDKRSLDAMKSIFTVDRVNVKFKADGDSHRLIAIEKVVGRPSGVVIGEVIKVYNNFWVAVKPKGGLPDGYALNWPPDKYKGQGDIVKSLKPGDLVAIKYSTDFERHRIVQIEVKPAAK